MSNQTILEKEPLESATKGNFMLLNTRFWKCMDTFRDKNVLEQIFKKINSIEKKILIVGHGFHRLSLS